MKNKTSKGITLIALVITIIILLILAGISIATLTGENGILGKSQKASEETNKQTATEKINLKITNIQIATYTEKQQMPNLQDLANGLCNDEENEIEYVITKDEPVASKLPFVNTNGYNSIFTKLTEYPYEFEIDSSLRLASIDGVKVADTSDNQEIENLKTMMGDFQSKITSLETTVSTLQSKLEQSNTNKTDYDYAINTEKKVGKWYDGSDMYEVSMPITIPNTNNGEVAESTIDLKQYNIKECNVHDGFCVLTNKNIISLPVWCGSSQSAVGIRA